MAADRANAELHIAAIASRYRETTTRLSLFVNQVQRALERDADRHVGIMKKLKAAEEASERGEPPSEPTPPDSIQLELEQDEFDLLVEMVDETLDAMDHFPGLLMEMAFIHLVAAFEAFLTDLARAVLVHRPEMLRSGKQVTFEEVVDAESKDELISNLADKEIGSLSYFSFRKQALYLEERFGLSLELSDGDLDRLVEAYARRNVLLHNAGVANQQFKDLAPRTDIELGESIEVSLSYWEEVQVSFSGLATVMENGVVNRFFNPEKG